MKMYQFNYKIFDGVWKILEKKNEKEIFFKYIWLSKE